MRCDDNHKEVHFKVKRLLTEMQFLALSHVGMCRADTREVFPEAAGAERTDRLWALWEALVESGRLALAPKNEMMSDDENVYVVCAAAICLTLVSSRYIDIV